MKVLLIISTFITFFIFSLAPISAQQLSADSLNNTTQVDTLIAAEYFVKANNFYKESNYDSTIFYYRKANEIYCAARNWKKCIDCYNKIGKNFSIMEEYEKAKDYLNKAIELNLKYNKGNNKLLADSYNYLGRMFSATDYNKAIENLSKSLEINISIYGKEHSRVASNYGNMGIVFSRQGNLDKAYKHYEKALNIHLKILGEEHPRIASSYNNMGLILEEKGYADSALVFQKKALAIRLKTLGENHLHTAASYNNIGHIYYNRGDFQNALFYEQRVLAIRLALLKEKHSYVAYTYNNIGSIYYELEDYDKALQYQEKALAIRLSILEKDHLHLAASYTNLGNIYEKLSQYQRALDYHNKTLKIYINKLGNEHPKVASCYHNIGVVYENKKDYEKAISFYRKAVEISGKEFGNKHPSIARDYNAIATGYKFLDAYDSTFVYVKKAIRANILGDYDSVVINRNFLGNVLSKKYLLSSILLKAETLYEMNDFIGAQKEFKLASGLINFIKKEYRNDESKLLLARKKSEVYEKAVQTELKLLQLNNDKKHLEEAFNYAESNKAGVLFESLNENQIKKFANIPDSLLVEENRLKTDLAYFISQNQNNKFKNSSSDSLKQVELDNKIFTLNRNYQALLDIFEKNYPEYNQLKYKKSSVTFDDISNHLNKKDALIEYFIGKNKLYIFVLTSDTTDVITISIDSGFVNLVESYIKSIKKNRKSEFVKISPQLHSYLIEPVKDFIKDKENLIIIPDGILLYVPFGSLIDNEISETRQYDFSSFNYLIKNFDISYHYSAALWLKGIEDEPETQKYKDNFIGFAPVFNSEDNGGYVSLSKPFLADSNLTELTMRSVSVDGKQYDELTYSENEVNDIVQLFAKSKKEAKGFLHSQASEKNFKEKTSNYKYVHLATHGFSNDKRTELSALLFANNRDASKQNIITSASDSTDNKIKLDDGILFAGETYNLNFNADLLVLSACETGIGKLAKGEGLMAITRGFLYSGTKNILFSLWKVGDKNTHQLMVKFYEEFLKGNSYSKAIKNAKLMLINKKETAFPKFWSGFVLIGK